jgi:hypothetical protein
MVPPPWTTPLTNEEYLAFLLGPGERPLVIFPVTPPEIEAILPKNCIMHKAGTVEGGAL